MKTYNDNSDPDNPVCYCGAIEDLFWGPNPFEEEIHGDDTPEWLCSNCCQEACDDI